MHGVRRAFTLIELLAVVVILAVLAGVAIPKFIDMQDRAKESACKGLLGGVRAGIASYFANEAITNGVGAYPTSVQVQANGLVMQGDLAANPYSKKFGVFDFGLGDANIRFSNNATGWAYYVDNGASPPAALFWANSNVANENSF